MAQAQSDAYVTALNDMANTVATTGGERRAGDYVVAYAQEEAEGMYHMDGGEPVSKARTARRRHRDDAEPVEVEFAGVEVQTGQG